MIVHKSILVFMLCPIVMGVMMLIFYLVSNKNQAKDNNVLIGVSGLTMCLITSLVLLKLAHSENRLASVEMVLKGSFITFEVETEEVFDVEGYPTEYYQDIVVIEQHNKQHKYQVENKIDFFTGNTFVMGNNAFIYKKGKNHIIVHEELSDDQKSVIINKYGMSKVYYWNFLWIGILFCISLVYLLSKQMHKSD